MKPVVHYISWGNGLWRDYGGLPAPARVIVGLVAVPFVIVAGLSVLALLVSLLALFAVTGPVYWALWRLCNLLPRKSSGGEIKQHGPSPGTKRVDSTVIG